MYASSLSDCESCAANDCRTGPELNQACGPSAERRCHGSSHGSGRFSDFIEWSRAVSRIGSNCERPGDRRGHIAGVDRAADLNDQHGHADVEWQRATESEFAGEHQRGELEHQCAAEPERQYELDGRVYRAVQPERETLMNCLRSILAAGLVSVVLFPAPARGQSTGEATGVQGSKNIRSLKEIRDEGVVKQRWDVSCGAAALSTLLTYDFKDNTPETSIVVWLLHRVDAGRVRARGGFSLLDLKHFAEARGYHAEAFDGMTIEDLALEKTSVIVPIRVKGFDHFVVVKGIYAGHVVVGDPGFGNMTMRVDRFQKLWKNGIVFVVHPPDERMLGDRRLPMAARLVPDESLISRKIGVTAPSNYLY